MRRLALLALLLLLAGCTTPSAPSGTDAGTDPPVLVVAPDDPNKAKGGAHLHDHWQGRGVLPLVDAAGRVGAMVGAGYSGFTYRPPEGSTVPLGTSHVAAWVNWTEDPQSVSYTKPKLLVQTAADPDYSIELPAENGLLLTVPSSNDKNDDPHSLLSAWKFQVVWENAGATVFLDDFTFQAIAVRGLDIPLYPPHGDLWQGRNELPLLDATATVLTARVQGGADASPDAFREHAAGDGAFVPPGATVVEVVVQAETPLPVGLRLLYRTAASHEPLAATGEGGGAEVRFHLDVGDGADSPYAVRSRWSFRLASDTPDPVQAWSGDYRIQATVHR